MAGAQVPAGADPKIKEIMTSLDDDKIGNVNYSCCNSLLLLGLTLLKNRLNSSLSN